MQITSTPCVSICRVDPGTGFCIGCGRTSTEIGRWVEMSEPDRLSLMAELPARFSQAPGLREAREAFDRMMASRVRTGRRSRL